MDLTHVLSYSVGGTTIGGGIVLGAKMFARAVKQWTELVSSVRDLTTSLKTHIDSETGATSAWRQQTMEGLHDLDTRVSVIESNLIRPNTDKGNAGTA